MDSQDLIDWAARCNLGPGAASEELGISYKTYYAYTKGTKKIPVWIEKITKYIDAFGVLPKDGEQNENEKLKQSLLSIREDMNHIIYSALMPVGMTDQDIIEMINTKAHEAHMKTFWTETYGNNYGSWRKELNEKSGDK